jgi:hypothetical protein
VCGLAYFHNFKETVVCSVSFEAKLTPTTKQQDAIKAQGNDIERWLVDEGWIKQQSYYLHPLGKFADTDYASTSYKKKVESIECLVSLYWQKSQPSTISSPATLSAHTGCGGKVKLFGGSDTLFDEALF